MDGKQPIVLRSGETRAFVQDGDTVILHGYCEREGYLRIGFGACWARLLGAFVLIVRTALVAA